MEGWSCASGPGGRFGGGGRGGVGGKGSGVLLACGSKARSREAGEAAGSGRAWDLGRRERGVAPCRNYRGFPGSGWGGASVGVRAPTLAPPVPTGDPLAGLTLGKMFSALWGVVRQGAAEPPIICVPA